MVAPARLDPGEDKLRPLSLHKLDEVTAALLNRLLTVTIDGLGTSAYVYCEVPILWVIDQAGDLWFSIEEIVSAEISGEFLQPRVRHSAVVDGTHRLGHPSLIAGQSGRIGGEIIYDPAFPDPAWYISNGSGRYGLVKGRKPEHLTNAKRLFSAFGINFREDFQPTDPP